jgi:4'-phosphopantetheinyl transferase
MLGLILNIFAVIFLGKQIAQSYFSLSERAVLDQIPAALKTEVFFTCWTRKEAYVKATGKGLSLPLDQFDVSLIPGEPAKLLHTQWDTQEAGRWLLQELVPGSSYVATLAVAVGGGQIKCWQWCFASKF